MTGPGRLWIHDGSIEEEDSVSCSRNNHAIRGNADRPGLTVKFAFNCILIDKDGIHHIDLKADDPIGKLASSRADESSVAAPNPPIDVGA
jgi:hypothetical protein